MIAEKFDGDTAKLIAEIGFIAVSYGLADHAEAIFKAFHEMRPEQEAGCLGLSLASMVRGDVDGALKHLEVAPPTDTIQTHRGLAYLRKGDFATAKEILSEICDMAPGTPCATVAAEALANMDKLANPLTAMTAR